MYGGGLPEVAECRPLARPELLTSGYRCVLPPGEAVGGGARKGAARGAIMSRIPALKSRWEECGQGEALSDVVTVL